VLIPLLPLQTRHVKRGKSTVGRPGQAHHRKRTESYHRLHSGMSPTQTYRHMQTNRESNRHRDAGFLKFSLECIVHTRNVLDRTQFNVLLANFCQYQKPVTGCLQIQPNKFPEDFQDAFNI